MNKHTLGFLLYLIGTAVGLSSAFLILHGSMLGLVECIGMVLLTLVGLCVHQTEELRAAKKKEAA